MTRSDRSFDDRLTDALTAPMTPGQRSALDARVLRPGRRGSGRRVRVVRRSLLLAAALLAIPLLGASAWIMSTEDPFGLSDAASFQQEIDAAKEAVPLPPGRDWPDHLRADPDAYHSTGGGRSWVETNAVCIWLDEWLDARAAGDPAREQDAAATISEIPTWPSWDSPFWTESVTDHLGSLIEAVEAGNAGPIEEEITLNCSWLAEDDGR